MTSLPSLCSFFYFSSFSFLFFYLSFPFLSLSKPTPPLHETFIALVDSESKPSPFQSHDHWYTSLLSSSSSSSSPPIHIYSTLFHGFSASLSPQQSKYIKKRRGILAVYPDTVLHLHTTRSPAFLGLNYPNSHLLNLSDQGSDIIIGIIDTGIWPERRSFSNKGLGLVPIRWRGDCEEGDGFTRSNCNRKLIGARYFSGGYNASPIGPINKTVEFRSPRDSVGHGTHVASIAAGARVNTAGFRGFAGGVARGMAPKARIAVYKVCWNSGCLLSDVCMAFEKAVTDGVDIISVSLGLSSAPFFLDPFAIASFRAMQAGVFVAVSAGNEGPHGGTVANSPPWILTVGAGTIDRDFPAYVILGNGKRVNGVSLSPQQELTRQSRDPLPLYLLGRVSSPHSAFPPELVRGRVVLCMVDRHVSRVGLGASLKYSGAAAMIISHGDVDPKGILAEPHVIHSIAVNVKVATLIEAYIKHGTNPTAQIFSQGMIHVDPAPMVASFSSRGPNMAIPTILKPDLLGPGVNILGAWTGAIAPSELILDMQRSEFNIMSGTSMACPHASGAAALIKASHPDWSPNEIKSALMTTASPRAINRRSPIHDEFPSDPASPFDMGAGQLQPDRAVNPGLVYDLGIEDYVNFLCQLNYTHKEVRIVTGKRVMCSMENKTWQLNYPAFVTTIEEIEMKEEVSFVRRLKKVDEKNEVTYRAKVVGLEGYDVWVYPKRLRFGRGVGERLSFKLRVRLDKKREEIDGNFLKRALVFGALVWKEVGGKLLVGSPIVVFSKDKPII